jgi:dTDP-4-amino-4,6-dideoxygalactose transaminase
MTAGKGIPFVDLITPHQELQEELLDAAKGVLSTGMFIGGPMVEQFEREFAQFCDARYCVGVSSGTDALRFALMASDVGPGDMVITVANTFVATIEAIVQTGATPQCVDVDPQTFNMSAVALRQFLRQQCDRPSGNRWPVHRATGKTVKAIMPVHLYGQMCDMDAILALAEEYGLMVFEDACQAHGSEYFSAATNSWRKAGSLGRAAAFSFYPGKNLGACGEAGAVTTNDEELAQRVRMIRDHGQNKKYHHLVEGYNGRLDALQAALLRVKLPFLKEWNASRRALAETYNQLLSGIETIRTPHEPDWSQGNYHLYVIVCAQGRDELQRYFSERNIATGLHYPIPCHLQKGYPQLAYHQGLLPETEALAGKILSLPIYPQLRREQQEQVAETLLQFYETQIVSSNVEKA